MNYTLPILKKLEQEFLELHAVGSGTFLEWLEARKALPRIVIYERTAYWTGSKTYFIYKVTNGVKELLSDEEGYRMQMRAKRDADEFANKLGLKVYWE